MNRAATTREGAEADSAVADALVAKPPKVFISYRRDDTRAFVEVLDGRLRQDLGSRNIFRDAKDLIAGELFERRIFDEIEQSDVVLIVIGPAWEGRAADHTGPPRLADHDDFVRQEVRIALASRPRSTPIPVLVDGASFPTVLPSDIEAIKEHHCVEIGREELMLKGSEGYQAILVGTWVAKSRSVPNGVIMFGDDSPQAIAQLDALVEEMKRRKLVDVTEISRYACGAQVLSLRKARHIARQYPNVIVVIDGESSDSSVLAARVTAMWNHPVGKIVIVTVGGGITYGAGVATGTGALSDLSADLGNALVKLGQPTSVTKPAKLWSWQATTPTAAKLAAGAIAVGALTGVGIAIGPQPGPHWLAGNWLVGDWQVEEGGIVPSTFHARTQDERWTIMADPADCQGNGCELDVVRQLEGIPRRFTLGPTGDGWQGVIETSWTCENDVGDVVVEGASAGRAVYTVRQGADSDILQVSYAYQGTPTEDGIEKCPGDGPLVAAQFTATAERTEE